MHLHLTLAIWGLSSLGRCEPQQPYEGAKVYRITTGPNPDPIASQLAALDLDIWNAHAISTHLDAVVPAAKLAAFHALNLPAARVLHADLGRSIATESAAPAVPWKRQVDDLAWYDSYHAYADHIAYFEALQLAFPNNSEVISSGTSWEGRDLYGLHLWGDGGPGKPVVLYHGTVHAREWITTMVVEYITLQLVTGYQAADPEVVNALDSFDFYIIPVVNPDGFVYSQTTDRLWRKNRQPGPANSTCLGRDINRNWAFAWDPTTGGSSANPCAQTYAGEAPADAPENQGLDALVRQLRDAQGIKAYIDWHSYGQYFLFPFGYNETRYAPQLGKWSRMGSLVSETIRDYVGVGREAARGTTFTFGPGGAVLYKSVGNSRDHIYEVGGADFTMTLELPDTGGAGFVLPPEQIRITAEEQWAGQLVYLSLLNEVFFDDEGPA